MSSDQITYVKLCPHCGFHADAGAIFCPKCLESLQNVAPVSLEQAELIERQRQAAAAPVPPQAWQAPSAPPKKKRALLPIVASLAVLAVAAAVIVALLLSDRGGNAEARQESSVPVMAESSGISIEEGQEAFVPQESAEESSAESTEESSAEESSAEPESPEPGVLPPYEEMFASLSDEAKAAYREVLEEKLPLIAAYEQLGENYCPVAFADLTGDGVPEMITVQKKETAGFSMIIYGLEQDQAVEWFWDNWMESDGLTEGGESALFFREDGNGSLLKYYRDETMIVFTEYRAVEEGRFVASSLSYRNDPARGEEYFENEGQISREYYEQQEEKILSAPITMIINAGEHLVDIAMQNDALPQLLSVEEAILYMS